MVPTEPPDGQVSYTEFLRGTDGYNCGQALAAIGLLSRAFEVRDSSIQTSRFRTLFPGSVDQWQLAFLAKSILLNSNDFAERQLNDEHIIAAAGLYNEMRDPRIGNSAVQMTDDDLVRFMVRTSHEQFTLQAGLFAYEIARAFILFDEIAAQVPPGHLSVSGEFQKLSGLTVRDFLSLGIIYWSVAGKPMTPPLSSPHPVLQDTLSAEKQEKFLSMVSTDYNGFRDDQNGVERRAGYEKWEFNSLQRFPLIRSPRFGKLICPIPPFLLRRFTRGIYYLLLDAFNRGEKDNRFASTFGKYIFEPYVGQQLRNHLPAGAVFGERRIDESQLTCDWIVQTDEMVLLVECKTTGLTAKAKAFADMNQIALDLQRRIASGVHACERTRAAIQAGKGDLGRFAGKPTANLVVVYDEVYLFNGAPFREIIDKELKSLGDAGAAYQVCTILDLEYALPALQRFGFGRFWQSKLTDPVLRDNGLARAVEKMVDRGEIPEPERNEWLQSKCAQLFDALLPPGRSVAT